MRKTIAITMGDPAGIGAEIIVKALAGKGIYDKIIPVVYGDLDPLTDALRFTHHEDMKIRLISSPCEAIGNPGSIDLINHDLVHFGQWQYKKNQALTGEASFRYITHAIQDAMNKETVGVVTAPISKEAIHMAGHNYSGHTEIFAEYTNTSKYAMLLSSKKLNVIHVTTHVSMEQACKLITKSRVLDVIQLAQKGMNMLGIPNPKIGVASFNAHCSENGLFGDQEEKSIIPAIEAAKAEGLDVTGPVPPDTVFCKAVAGVFDIVVAMYHDQGHIPLKLTGFQMDPATNTYSSMSGINCTIGLPIMRSSVDHGTAYGKAGEGRANEESMLEAIYAGIKMAEHF